jgi:hypothetical protein
MKDFLAAYLAVVNLLTIQIILALIGVDILFGIILALKNHEFSFAKLADFLTSDGVPFIVYLALGFPAMLIANFKDILLAIGVTLIAALTAMVLDKAAKLLGFPIPKILKE